MLDGIGRQRRRPPAFRAHLHAEYQGTAFRPGRSPVLNLDTPEGTPPGARAGQLRLLDDWNRAHLRRHPGLSELEARIANFETAARMQLAVPEAVDLATESEATRKLYGLDNPKTRSYGTRMDCPAIESIW